MDFRSSIWAQENIKKANWLTDWFKAYYLYVNMIEKYNDDSLFVEIGTWTGKSTAFMASLIKSYNKKIIFHTIDTFKGSPDEPEHNQIVNAHGGDLFTICYNNLKKCDVLDYVNIIKSDSVEASRLFSDESIDFLYVDGGHSYNQIIADIKAWYNKLKIGATLAGDDIDYPAVYDAIVTLFDDDFWVDRYSWIHTKKENKSWN